jgi:hypothetical protein
VRGQPIALYKVRLASLHLPGAGDRVWDERQQVLAPNIAGAAHLGVVLVEESPQVLERVVLVARGGIDIADPLRVGLQVELVYRSEALRDTGAGDQLGRRQPPAPQPPLGALLGRAVQGPKPAEHRVQDVDPPGRRDRHPLQVLVADLLERVVAAGEQHAQPQQRGTPLRLPPA